MDQIEACMLDVGDLFKISETDNDWYVMRGWNFNLMMPMATSVPHKEERFFMHPNRKVYVNKFFNN